MNISKLLEELSYEVLQGTVDQTYDTLVYDSRKIENGSVFVCLKGAAFDGHEFVTEAYEKGAIAVVVEKEVQAPEGLSVIRVANTREALAYMAAAHFDHPAKKLKTVGVTGTKGKTTTVYMVKSILERAGFRVGLVGTIEILIGETAIPAINTTPESYTLQEYFAQMVEAGLDTVVMEVSSQGLMMHRVDGFTFDIGIFTNLSPDHIGPNEHDSFEDYMQAKGLLFQKCKLGVVNIDDPYTKDVIAGHTCEIKTYGFHEEADFKATNMEYVKDKGILGMSYQLKGVKEGTIRLHLPGKFSVYNSLTAIAICHQFGVEQSVLEQALLDAQVKGRIEPVPVSEHYTMLIDYAHNAMSLESLLTSLKVYEPKRLICIFGCGGNRSKLRRFEMGEVSGRLCDLTIITSDNPRFEEPALIMEDIKTGIEKTDGAYVMIADRKEAIRYAMEHAKEGDVIVLAGKGHETYQEIRGVKYPMEERTLILEAKEELQKDNR